jgi:hypothetical protein
MSDTTPPPAEPMFNCFCGKKHPLTSLGRPVNHRGTTLVDPDLSRLLRVRASINGVTDGNLMRDAADTIDALAATVVAAPHGNNCPTMWDGPEHSDVCTCWKSHVTGIAP